MNDRMIILPSQATAADTAHSEAHVGAIRILCGLLTVLTMLSLKRHYSLATADQLDWILAPTARLVAWLTPAHPVYEYGVGYVDFSQNIIVAPACAGINFMIMAFGLAALCGLVRIRRISGLLAWPVAALACAYGYTLMVNTLRIAISMALYRADIYSGWMTMERLHRLAGIGLYVVALWLFFIGLQTIINRYCRCLPRQGRNKDHVLPDWLPFGWYVTGAVGVPVANLLFEQGAPSLVEHCLTIGIAVIFISTIIWAVKSAMTHLMSYMCKAKKERHASHCVDC